MAESSKQSLDLLRAPSSDQSFVPATRTQTKHAADSRFAMQGRSYQQQFSDMYFLRLTKLKPAVEAIANEAWDGEVFHNETVHRVDRVLDVRQGELCWVAGTVYMDMPLKPNILEDISKDHFLVSPPPREKYHDMGVDQTMLEDESGRLRLVGSILETQDLVTGVVIAVLGSETSNGDFEVIDVKVPDLPNQRELKKKTGEGSRKVALTSGLGINGSIHENLETHLLVEYLLGEAGGLEDHDEAAKISRLILAGNSLGNAQAPLVEMTEDNKKARTKKYGYDATAYNPSPTTSLDAILSSLLPSVAVTIIPGVTDPANVALPQQELHRAIFPTAKVYDGSTFERGTNPWAGEIEGIRLVGTGGQNLDDVYKYIEGDDRLAMCERILRWRIIAPTAPDTLWSYPFQQGDPFVLEESPHVFFVGNQPRFETKLVEGIDGQMIRIILLPRFDDTGEIALLDLDTLDCEVMSFKVESEKNVMQS